MLEVSCLDAGYGAVQALWDVSLRVGQGEIVCVLGPNGAGKSTLLRSILGMARLIHTGGITYLGRRIDGLAPEEIVRLGIALIPEEKHLFLEMSVLENLEMGAYAPRARKHKAENLAKAFELFPRLAERRGQMVKTLSGGERQMVAFGRALMSMPSLLLIDEPSVGLTPAMTAKMLEAVREINRGGVTVLLVEQNVYLTLEISDRAYVLENGRIVMAGAGAEMLHDEHIKTAYLAM